MSAPAVARPVPDAVRRNAYWRLFGVEARRFVARAAVRWLLLAMVAVVAVAALSAYRATMAPSQARLDQAQQAYEQQRAFWEQNADQQLADCRAAEAAERERQPDEQIDFACDQMEPTPEMFLPYRPTFAEAAPGWLQNVSTFLLMAALVIGATFVAAEFATGNLATWLTFEPRRGRVLASKVAVATLATAIAVLVAQALAVGATWLACRLNDSVGDMTPQAWRAIVDQGLRAVALAAGVTALGAALAFLLRHTAAVVAVAFAWLVVIENLLRAGLMRGLDRWTVQLNLTAWLQGGLSMTVGSTGCVSDTSGVTTCDGEQLVITMTQSGVFLLGLVAVVVLAALLVFRRRDVA